ncbi:Protein kinase, ATP binding site-containing protein, partial [Cynara cardunculus var. scolymus]
MNLKISILFLIFISKFPSFKSQKSIYCDRKCPGGVLKHVPYPFGFSSGCEIQLNCASNGTVSISEFDVQEINQDALLVSLPAKCGRAVAAFHRLYSDHYAPTSNNAILMENCTGQVRTCMIPATMVQTHLEILDCGGESNVYSNVSCYSGDKHRMFLDYENLTRTGCRVLLSGIVSQMIGDSPAVSLDVQVVKLGWWLKGQCQCSDDAICTKIVSPADGSAAYRCQCQDGFVGDGYKANSGCRKGSSPCNLSKYLTGRCEGKSRVGILIGAVTIGASSIVCVCLVYCYLRHRTISKYRYKRNRRFCGVKGITIPIYPYKEIEKATNSFSDKQKLGTGAYGTVYSGKLRNGEWVAIKRIRHRGCLDEIIDPFLVRNKDTSTCNSIHKVSEVAFRCLAFDSDMRPPMTEVLVELEQIRASDRASLQDTNNVSSHRSLSFVANKNSMGVEVIKNESDT